MDAQLPQRRTAYWRNTVIVTKLLLAVWFLVTFCVIFFARELARVTIAGWPLSFYMAAQGIMLVYLAIIAVHVWCMRRLDKALENGASNGQQ